MVLIGHSNSGKSPLGEQIESHASSGTGRFRHFDFGHHLRLAAAGGIDCGLAAGDIDFIRSILNGTLLDDGHFFIARALLEWFVDRSGFDRSRDTLLLNGLPRHRGQAEGLRDAGVSVTAIIHCDCSAEVAWQRKLLADAGEGHEDRSRRPDGAPEVFKKRIVSFETETLPLLEFYRGAGVPVITLPIAADTTPAEAFRGFKILNPDAFDQVNPDQADR
jgi:adenylate kinase family enzyme